MTQQEWRSQFAKTYATGKARNHPSYMGWTLAQYQRREGLTDAALATQPGLAVEDLPRLALCLRPRAEHWAEDLRQIAAHVGTNEAALQRICEVVRGGDPIEA